MQEIQAAIRDNLQVIVWVIAGIAVFLWLRSVRANPIVEQIIEILRNLFNTPKQETSILQEVCELQRMTPVEQAVHIAEELQKRGHEPEALVVLGVLPKLMGDWTDASS